MKHLLLAFCLTSLLLSVARAEEAAPAIALKQKSTFDAPNDRDPFWPIGWKKPGPKNPDAGPSPNLSPGDFSLTSITMGSGQRFAILNGKVMLEGQQFGVQVGKQIYQVTLRSIEDGQIILGYQDGEIAVPLRRK